jgi:outer membrane biosynthesis protein TonB
LNFFGKRSYKSGDEFSPASPLREVKPQLSDENPPRAAVDVRVWIDDKGDVTKSELITEHVQPDIADIASNAANKWKFKPARLSDRPVSSELVMHFRFVPKQNY